MEKILFCIFITTISFFKLDAQEARTAIYFDYIKEINSSQNPDSIAKLRIMANNHTFSVDTIYKNDSLCLWHFHEKIFYWGRDSDTFISQKKAKSQNIGYIDVHDITLNTKKAFLNSNYLTIYTEKNDTFWVFYILDINKREKKVVYDNYIFDCVYKLVSIYFSNELNINKTWDKFNNGIEFSVFDKNRKQVVTYTFELKNLTRAYGESKYFNNIIEIYEENVKTRVHKHRSIQFTDSIILYE